MRSSFILKNEKKIGWVSSMSFISASPLRRETHFKSHTGHIFHEKTNVHYCYVPLAPKTTSNQEKKPVHHYTGAPNGGFLLNALKTHFGLSRVLSGPAEQFSKGLKLVYLVPTHNFLIQLQLINHFLNSYTNEKEVRNKKSVTLHSSIIIFACFIYFKSLSVLSLRLFRTFL